MRSTDLAKWRSILRRFLEQKKTSKCFGVYKYQSLLFIVVI